MRQSTRKKSISIAVTSTPELRLNAKFDGSPYHVGDGRFTCSACGLEKSRWEFPEVVRGFKNRNASYYGRSGRHFYAHHSECDKCRAESKSRVLSHSMYSKELDKYWKAKLVSVVGGARTRCLLVAIDCYDLMELFFEQNGCCALSGLSLNIERDNLASGKKSMLAPSVDRINSAGHYTPDNIQIVSVAANIMKSDMSTEAFIEMCRAVAVHNMAF